ncbi:MAG: ImmA/IrrE family metallo-endopeptidase, partial [Phycisphaerae bacterium]|nr:ImmA/IrrE family metallo-endopeptidase [Phycisphaerae bacterium]
MDIDAIIQSKRGLGLGLEVRDTESVFGARADGATSVPDRLITIDSRLEEHPARFRFTAAHEAGHWVQHRHKDHLFLDTSLDDGLRFEHRLCEREANYFAAQVLMPTRPLLRY